MREDVCASDDMGKARTGGRNGMGDCERQDRKESAFPYSEREKENKRDFLPYSDDVPCQDKKGHD